MKNFISLFIKGIFVGVANIIPGVSGGTIAVVLRIFDEFIDSINNFFKEPKKHMKFLIPIGFGALVGIGIFSKIIQFLLKSYSFPTTMFFVGLVVGSVPIIYNQAKKNDVKLLYYFVSLIFFFIIVGISLVSTKDSSDAIDVSFSGILRLVGFGAISSASMVVPGVSGSFVMVLLGIYNSIILSISGFLDVLTSSIYMISSSGFIFAIKNIFTSQYFLVLMAIFLGVVLGIVIISKIISILLDKAFSLTYFAILGLIFGSIFSIFNDPITYQSYDGSVPIFSILTSIFTFCLGVFISIKFSE